MYRFQSRTYFLFSLNEFPKTWTGQILSGLEKRPKGERFYTVFHSGNYSMELMLYVDDMMCWNLFVAYGWILFILPICCDVAALKFHAWSI